MTKQFKWNSYTIQITKKKIKKVNLRIKPDEPDVIHMSVPYHMTYDAALQVLKQPRILKWLENYEKKRSNQLVTKKDWYEEHKEFVDSFRERLQNMLPELFCKWEKIIGVKKNKITIRDTRSQWGSCNTRTHNISMSVWLGAYPKECVEYVVVHELVHLLEKGHNAKFYGYLDKYYPNWKECKNRLKRLEK